MNRIPRQGDRIRLLAMRDDPDPIQVGQLGTVVSVSAPRQRQRRLASNRRRLGQRPHADAGVAAGRFEFVRRRVVMSPTMRPQTPPLAAFSRW